MGWTPAKLEAAYAAVARKFGVDLSTVKRAARQHLERIKEEDEMVYGASSLQEVLRRRVDNLNRALQKDEPDGDERKKGTK